MKQVGARHDIIREWRSLPKEQRQTDEQAEAFAMQIKDKYKFSNDSADPYQTVRSWLLSYLSLTRGLGVNAKDKGEMSGELVGHLNSAPGTEKRLDRSTDRLFPVRGRSRQI
jgi:hypothetical protein